MGPLILEQLLEVSYCFGNASLDILFDLSFSPSAGFFICCVIADSDWLMILMRDSYISRFLSCVLIDDTHAWQLY